MKIVFIITYSANTDQVSQYVAFHLGLHCLLIILVSSMFVDGLRPSQHFFQSCLAIFSLPGLNQY